MREPLYAQALPVDPKPPFSRAEVACSSTTRKAARTTGTMTICAMRSIGCTEDVTAERCSLPRGGGLAQLCPDKLNTRLLLVTTPITRTIDGVAVGTQEHQMTFQTLTVVLERDMPEDDAESLLTAIRQMRGVLSVSGEVADFTTHMDEDRARAELTGTLLAALRLPAAART